MRIVGRKTILREMNVTTNIYHQFVRQLDHHRLVVYFIKLYKKILPF
jgi:hypothetical protein